MERRSTFIRDLLVKILLIAIFLFLLMYLFPMPNLTPFYSAIFNNNIQTMKDAADDYYTVKNMPTVDGESVKMTLKEMEEKKLIIPFVDKDGKTCNKKKSYVKVTKDGDEYVLKVSLTCSDESNYIIERIGCKNFCPQGICGDKTIAEVTANENKKVVCDTDDDGVITVKVPTGDYVTEYEYKKVTKTGDWVLGQWQNTKEVENETTKLNDTRTQYTGQKKVTANTTLYEQVAYGYKDNWTVGSWQDTKDKETETYKLHSTRTLYTGQKKVTSKTTEYKHVKYGYKDNWVIGNWQDTKDKETDTHKLHDTRTLYTGQKKVTANTTLYEEVKYGYRDKWTVGEWQDNKDQETSTHKLYATRTLYTGQKLVVTTTTRYQYSKTKYVLQKTITNKSTQCTDWIKDTNWYSSKPASTAKKVYGDAYNSKTSTSWKLIQSSYKSYQTMPSIVETGGVRYKYELVSKQENPNCGSNCSTNRWIYYYNVYKEVKSTQYQYYYKNCTETTSTSTDTKTVYKKADADKLISQGYTLKSTTVEDTMWSDSATAPANYEFTGQTGTKTTNSYISLGKWVTSKEALGEYTYNISTRVQYKYADLTREKYLIDTKWITSKTPDAGYELTGKTKTTQTTTYIDLGKWVTSKTDLGEYTYNIKTKTQYRYKDNNRTKYIIDTKWTTSKTPATGYEYTGETRTSESTKYVDLGKWVTSVSELGEYTYNIKTKTQYRYKTNNRTKYVKDTIWTTTNKATNGYVLTGKTKVTTETTYIDLGYYVNSKSELKEYTYNTKTRTQYRYKRKNSDTSTEYKWAKTNPGEGWVATGKSRTTFVQTGYKTETRPARSNQQK